MGSSAISCMRYHDADSMLEWLCNVFGFNQKAVYRDRAGSIDHCELTLDRGMVMIGSVREDEFSKLQQTPEKLGGNTQSVCLVVNDPDTAYEKAKTAGAKIASPIEDKHYGGRGFSCYDPEGYLWHVGSYDPWA